MGKNKEINCIIVDDDILAINRLERLLSEHHDVKILMKATDPQLALEAIIQKKPNILFIDIEMPLLSGIDLVEKLHLNQCFPAIIFVSAFSHYTIDAIRLSSFDYLVKPINISELKNSLERFRSESVNHKIIDLNKSPVCYSLSHREKEVLFNVMKGDSSDKTASKLFISKSTVNFHRKNILLKTETNSLIELIQKITNSEIMI